MKTFLPSLLILAACAASPSLHAQILPGAVPWITTTDARLTAAFDADADGSLDVLSLDREQGSFTLGLRQPDGSYAWSTPRSVGFGGVENMAVGRFISPSSLSIVVSSRDFNSVQPVPLDGSDLPAPLGGFTPPEPQALATHALTSGQQPVAIGYAGSDPQPLAFCTIGQNFSSFQNYNMAANARHAGTVYLRTNYLPVIAVLGDDTPATNARMQIFRADDSSSEHVTEWNGLPAASRYVPGFFAPDLAAQTQNYHSATLITWVPGSSMLRIARLTSFDSANNTSYEDLTFEPLPLAFNMQRPLRTVHVLYKPGGHRLLLTYADAIGGASIHDFDGVNVPTLVEGLALNGLDLDAITPLSSGEFLASGTRGGLPAWDRYGETTPGHYTATATGALPAKLPNQAFYSNVVAFSGEPFVSTTASALKRARVADWTTGGTAPGTMGGNASITALTDGGSSTGLGSPGSTSLSVPGGTSHLLLSQITPLSSIAFLSAKTAQQSQQAPPQFQPPGGQYAPLGVGESLSVIIEVPGAGFDSSVKYSLNGSPWQLTSRFDPVLITGPATLRAFAFSYLTGTSPIVTTSYTFGTLPPVAAQPATDADMDGLSDDWEKLTSITDPAADSDGDGYLNLAEHNAGFDPGSASSKPATVTSPPQLAIVDPSAQNNPPTLRWSAADTAILLETSADLQTWSLVTHGTRVEGAERVFDLPTSSFALRFYRLRR
ncbi:MAG: hypothetical protein ACK5TH_17680 [Prosthecobacter sp.]